MSAELTEAHTSGRMQPWLHLGWSPTYGVSVAGNRIRTFRSAMKRKTCKDCPPKNKPRPAPHPGPRCATHWRAELKRRQKANHDNYVQRAYSLSQGEYEALYLFQGQRCYLCRRATGATRRLSVDHDHSCCPGPVSCGQCVRGLVCRKCNDMLGHAHDEWRFFSRAIAYLFDPPYRKWRRESG